MKCVPDIKGWWRRASRRLRWFVVILVLLLVVIRLCLPFAAKAYVNRQLNRSKDYGGRITEVDIKLWAGEYQIRGIEIFKKSGGVRTPFFASPRVDLSVQWKELFHGAMVGEVVMHYPKVNYASGPTPEQTQTGTGEEWDKLLESLFPFKLNRMEIVRGQIHFQNEHSTPPVDIYLNELNAIATNLTNARDLTNALPAGVLAKATTIGGGGLDLNLQLNPMMEAPTYQITAQLTNVDLTALNSFLQAYGKFDVERGDFALYTSVASKEGNYEGYLKVFFNNLDVFDWEKERKKNALQVFWQAIVGTLTTAFKNQPNDSLATRVPISGSYTGDSVGTWSAITTLLRNAFIRALVPKVDEKVTLNQVEEKIERTDEKKKDAKTNDAPDAGTPKTTIPK